MLDRPTQRPTVPYSRKLIHSYSRPLWGGKPSGWRCISTSRVNNQDCLILNSFSCSSSFKDSMIITSWWFSSRYWLLESKALPWNGMLLFEPNEGDVLAQSDAGYVDLYRSFQLSSLSCTRPDPPLCCSPALQSTFYLVSPQGLSFSLADYLY